MSYIRFDDRYGNHLGVCELQTVRHLADRWELRPSYGAISEPEGTAVCRIFDDRGNEIGKFDAGAREADYMPYRKVDGLPLEDGRIE